MKLTVSTMKIKVLTMQNLLLWVCTINLFFVFPKLVSAQNTGQNKKKSRVAVMVFAKPQADESIRVRVERDLRAMVNFADTQKKLHARLYPIEPFFDVGQLSTANLHKSERHFNEAQRAIEASDYQEANEQLLRARRFFLKGTPYVYQGNEELLQNIFYFDYVAYKNLKKKKKARDLYCKYVSLSRNLTESVGPIEQYDVLANLCEKSPISGTAELKLSSNVDGAHVYVNNQAVAVIGRNSPYVAPFMSAGIHLVEIRKIGYARWGKLVTLANGKTKKLKGKLKQAKNYTQDYLPLANLPLRGEEAFSETYLLNFFIESAERYRVNTLIIAYLEKVNASQNRLSIFTFKDDMLEPKFEKVFSSTKRNAHHGILAKYWRKVFGFDIDPDNVETIRNRWTPTFFKVD